MPTPKRNLVCFIPRATRRTLFLGYGKKKEDALCVQDEVKSTEVQVKEENPINHDEIKLSGIRGRNCSVSPTQQVKEEVQGNVASLKKVSFSRA